jgi:hypothetical protein
VSEPEPPVCNHADVDAEQCAAALYAGHPPCADECQIHPVPYAEPPAQAEHREYTEHRYPPPRPHRGQLPGFPPAEADPPGFRYHAPPGGTWPEQWVELGEAAPGECFHFDYSAPSGTAPSDTALSEADLEAVRRAIRGAEATVTFELAEIGAVNLRTALTGDTEWTIGDALRWLHPAPPRRTVSRWLREMTPVGRRRQANGGPPARTYSAAEIMRRHARWLPKHPEGS